MNLTLANLRNLPKAGIENLTATELATAKTLVTDEAKRHLDEAERICNVAGNRELTRTQQADYDAAIKRMDDLVPLRDTIEEVIESRAGIDRSVLARLNGNLQPDEYGQLVNVGPSRTFRAGQPLKADQRMSDYARSRNLYNSEDEELSTGKYLRGLITGDWSGATREMRALAEGTNGAGGYLLPAPMSTRIIDKARNKTRVIQAGAQTVPMESSTLKVPRLATDPTAAWHTENATITPSDPAFEAVTLTAHTLAAITTISLELLEDTDVDNIVETAFADVFALKLDLAALYGTGTPPEPLGVKNTSGITTSNMVTLTGGAMGADDYIDAVTKPMDSNFEATGVITSVRTNRSLMKLKATGTGEYMLASLPEPVRSVPLYSTLQIPTNLTVSSTSNTGDMFVADWREMLIGIRHTFSIKVLNERYADTGSVGLLAWFRGDIALRRPAAFHVVSGITN